jgi:5-methylcytosine-specific restriction enzyme A
MPMRAQHNCTTPGCRELVRGRAKCPRHTQDVERRRGSPFARGYDTDWRRVRAEHIAANPWCAECLKICVSCRRVESEHGKPSFNPHETPCPAFTPTQTQATQVDHATPFQGEDDPLRLDPANLVSMCASCHGRKTRGQRVLV